MYFYLYQITNKLNGHVYVGVHKTKDINDGYMGSGKYLRKAQEKYGLENFEKIILEQFSSAEEMFTRETEIVTTEFCMQKDTYNIREGGRGGFTLEATEKGRDTQRKLEIGIFSKEFREKLREFSNSERNKEHLRLQSKRVAESIEIQLKKKETFKRIGHQKGEKNSRYGTVWITNGVESKTIRKEEVIPEGWRKGRVIKG